MLKLGSSAAAKPALVRRGEAQDFQKDMNLGNAEKIDHKGVDRPENISFGSDMNGMITVACTEATDVAKLNSCRGTHRVCHPSPHKPRDRYH